MSELSQDANDIAVGLFGSGMSKEVVFGLRVSAPSYRCAVALKELLTNGYITQEVLKPKGCKYTPTDKLRKATMMPVDRNSGLMITQKLAAVEA